MDVTTCLARFTESGGQVSNRPVNLLNLSNENWSSHHFRWLDIVFHLVRRVTHYLACTTLAQTASKPIDTLHAKTFPKGTYQ